MGGTNAFGEFIDPVEADFTREGAQIAEVHINTVVERAGTDGRDFIFGRRDDDLVDAGGGNDKIITGRGWDVIDGGEGNDWIAAGRGADVIQGGEGFDIIRGGRGDDQFLFSTGDDYDVIKDFNRRGDDDQLVLNVDGIETFQDVLDSATELRFGTLLDFGDGDAILLRRVDLDDLSASDFLFA